MSLRRWSAIMDTYEKGGFGYHTTMPTDALRDFHEISVETLEFGLPELKTAQLELGQKARGVLDSKGLTSVAAPGFQAPGVLVYYSPERTDNPVMMTSFKSQGLQIAMGGKILLLFRLLCTMIPQSKAHTSHIALSTFTVPWKIDEPEGLKTFRIGLFGLDKLGNVDKTVATMETALDAVLNDLGHEIPKAA